MVGEIVGVGAAGVIAGGLLSKEIVAKLLGPTAEYLGVNIKDFVQKRAETLNKIFAKAISKSKNLEEEGAVPPKVLRDILNEATFNEDAISIEYFGGVLASSKTGISRDDRASTITAALARLSTYEIRAHYVIYSCIREIFSGSSVNIYEATGRSDLKVYMPFEVFTVSMDFSEQELSEATNFINHCMFGLARDSLIDDSFSYGSPEHMKAAGVEDPGRVGGILVGPSVLGAEMFLRAHGMSQSEASNLTSTSLSLQSSPDVIIAKGSRNPKSGP